MSDDYDSVLLVVRECYVYRIPPRSTSRGYRASDWDVNQHLWTGRLRIVAKGDLATIRLEDANTGDIFAISPYDPTANTVEPVMDSSRYFVVRIVDPASKQHAFVGLGFPERAWAFDFNVALQDHTTQTNRQNQPTASKPSADTGSKVDYSWKEGETISINIGNVNASKKARPKEQTASAAAIPFLPPPPSGTRSASTPQQQSHPQQQQQQDSWADFGDFVPPGSSNSNATGANQGSGIKNGTENVPTGWTTF